MAPTHRYDLIRNSDDGKDEVDDIKNGPPTNNTGFGIPWWKVLLYMLLAGSAGFGAAFGGVVASSYLKNNEKATATATESTTLAPEVRLPTATPASSVDHVEDKVNDPQGMGGKILECGYSPEAARANGCVFDVMMQDWVPEPCYDPVLTEKYLAEGNYTWYKDIDGNIMSDEEMAKGEHGEAWMTGDYHKAHCIFSWEKIIRALRNDRAISQELLSYDHVLHCHMQTLGGEMGGMHKRDAIGVKAPTNYAKCALYDTWKYDFVPDKHSSVDKK